MRALTTPAPGNIIAALTKAPVGFATISIFKPGNTASLVKYAMIGADGPTGKFFSDYGESPW